MKELENLLKFLVYKGRKPYGQKIIDLRIEDNIVFMLLEDFFVDDIALNLRSIASLKSGLWQFVTDNKLFNKNLDTRTRAGDNLQYDIYDYQYRLLESALIPEEKLGKFLLDNIILCDMK